MMKQEFEKIAGYEVSAEDYKVIEAMYMATSLSKQDFVKVLNRKRFALRSTRSIVKEMKQIGEHLKETCDHYYDMEARDRLDEVIEEYMERKGYINAGIKTAGYMTNSGMTIFKCYYPREVEIYGLKDYKTIERIQIA